MSADINNVTFTGRLVKDVEIKAINHSFLMTGSFAVNRSFKKGEDWVEEASFFNFKQWVKSEKQKDFLAQRLKKGTQISIDGQFVQERWEKDGQKQSTYFLYVNNIIPCFPSSNGNSESSTSSVPSNSSGFPDDVVF